MTTFENASSSQQDDKDVEQPFMPNLTGKKLFMGYWHNWQPGLKDGYKEGRFKELALTDIRKEYNVVSVAFMKGSGIPTFKPYNMSDDEFRNQVKALNAQGRAVLISLGGADAHIELKNEQHDDLVKEIIRLVDTYGFSGLDIDLEQAAIAAADNATVIPKALITVKDYYRNLGLNFIISMAPEFPHLKQSGSYKNYINLLKDYYDFIAPQYYNQAGDGIWVDEISLDPNKPKGGRWLAQNNDELKKEFLYFLTESIVKGIREFIQIPSDRFMIGLPSNNDAAGNGYVINPDDLINAVNDLEKNVMPIKGLMTWSINWDDGTDKNGKSYNWEFASRYGKLFAN